MTRYKYTTLDVRWDDESGEVSIGSAVIGKTNQISGIPHVLKDLGYIGPLPVRIKEISSGSSGSPLLSAAEQGW